MGLTLTQRTKGYVVEAVAQRCSAKNVPWNIWSYSYFRQFLVVLHLKHSNQYFDSSVFKILRKENKISQDLRISADLIDSALGYRGIFEGWKVGCITYLKIYIKIKVNIPRTEVIMGDEGLTWAAKHIFLCFSWNRHGLYSLGPNKCYTIALLHDIKFGITLLCFI